MPESRNVLSPEPTSQFNPLQFASPTEREAIRAINVQRGAYIPESTQERLQVQTGQAGGVGLVFSEGFGEGLLGAAYRELWDSPVDIDEQARRRETLASYARENTLTTFFGTTAGRFLSDSPLDFAIGLGSTQIGKTLVQFMVSSAASAKATDKVAKAVQLARKGDPSLTKRVYTDAAEGLIAGVASESIQEHLGKETTTEEIIEAGLMDMIASPVFSESLRGLGKVVGWSRNKLVDNVAEEFSDATGIPKAEVLPTIEQQLQDTGLLQEARAKFETAKKNEESLAALGKTPEDILRDISENFVRRSDEADTLIVRDEKTGKVKQTKALKDRVDKIAEIIKASPRELEVSSAPSAARRKELIAEFERRQDLQRALDEEDIDVIARETGASPEEIEMLRDRAHGLQKIAEVEQKLRTQKLLPEKTKSTVEGELSEKSRKLLGTGDDIKKLSDESGIPIKDLELYRDHVFSRMEQTNLEKNLNSVRVDALQTRVDHIDQRIREGKLTADGPTSRSVDGMPAVRNLDEFRTMGKFFGISEDYLSLASEMITRRAKALKISTDKWLEVHNIQYQSSGGPHVMFDDAATILNAPAKATSVEDFFHELGHIFEADLDAKTRKTLADHYGMDGFSREFSEKFANDFLRYLADAGTKGRSTFPKSLKEAFNRVAEWLSEVFNGLTGGTKIDNEVRDMFDRLFLDKSQRSNVQRVKARRKKFVERLGEDRTRYSTPDEIENDIIGDRAEVLKTRIEGAGKELDSRSAPLAKEGIIRNILRKVPKFLGAGILTAENLFRGLGSNFSKMYDELLAGIQAETKLIHTRRVAMRQIQEDVGLTEADLNKLDGLEVEVKGKKIKANEAILLHMYARDGLKSDGTNAQHSARVSLNTDGYRFEEGKPATKFTKVEVDEMATTLWLEQNIGQEAVRAVEVMRRSLDTFGAEFNEFYKARTGEDAFDIDTAYFHKKTTQRKRTQTKDGKTYVTGLENFEGEMAKAFAKMEKYGRMGDKRTIFQTIADTTAVNHVREGTGILEYQDPFASTMMYINQISRLEALGDSLSEAQIMHKFLEPDIREAAGQQIHEAMGDILNRSAGQSAFQDPVAGKWFNRMYKGQVMSALSWNLSTPLKQTPSMMAALMRIPKVKDGASGYIDYLTKGISNKIEIDGKEVDLHEYLMENHPTYAVRYETAGQSPDISDANISDAFRGALFGNIKIADAMEAQGIVGAGKAFVEKGMTGIREADAAAIRGIYLAVRDSLGDGATPEAVEEMATRIINETQPTYHPLTRTSTQASRNIVHRQMALFSSQPVKNFNMLMRDIQRLQDGGLSAEEISLAKKRIKTTTKMLALQASAVAGMGIVASNLKDVALDSITDEEVVKKRDNYLEAHGLEWSKEWSQLFGATFGNLPYSGPLLGELLKRATVGDGFDLEIMPINYINDVYKWAESVGDESFGRQTVEVMTNIAKVFGTPMVGVQVGKAIGSNVEL